MNLNNNTGLFSVPSLEDTLILLKAYYGNIERLADSAFIHADRLANRPLFAEYVYHAKFLITEVRIYLGDRRDSYLPYVLELAGKSSSGHNCQHCAGRCEMQHTVRMLELASSLKKMESTTSFIQSELELIYRNEQLKGSLRWLSNEMEMLIDALLNALQFEEANLVPGVKAAQKNINAHS